MKRTRTLIIAILVGLLLTAPVAAQKGTGDAQGVARQADVPSIVRLSGQLLEIKTGPCEKTTGRAVIGAHLLLENVQGQTLNLHLGPADAVDHVTDQLTAGDSLAADAFRTPQLPANAYIVKSLILPDKVVHLRDENLRPSWAYGRGSGDGDRQGRGPKRGHWGPCW